MLRYFKPVIFLACLAPLASLAWRGFHAGLGANPIEAITHSTGDCTLTFLLITLSVTPLRKLTRQYWLINLRRMFGLFAFFYGCLHLTTYVWLDKFFDVHEMLADIAKRRFITAGLTGFLLMLPLALTSTKGWIRRLGHPLHLAGQGRPAQTAAVWFRSGGVADVPAGSVLRRTSKGGRGSCTSAEDGSLRELTRPDASNSPQRLQEGGA